MWFVLKFVHSFEAHYRILRQILSKNTKFHINLLENNLKQFYSLKIRRLTILLNLLALYAICRGSPSTQTSQSMFRLHLSMAWWLENVLLKKQFSLYRIFFNRISHSIAHLVSLSEYIKMYNNLWSNIQFSTPISKIVSYILKKGNFSFKESFKYDIKIDGNKL